MSPPDPDSPRALADTERQFGPPIYRYKTWFPKIKPETAYTESEGEIVPPDGTAKGIPTNDSWPWSWQILLTSAPWCRTTPEP